MRRLLDRRLGALVDSLPEPPAHDPAQALDDALALGLLGLGLPADVGGAGGFADLVVAHEELGHGLAPPLATTLTLAGRLLLQTSGAADRDRSLAELAAGRRLAAPALEEDEPRRGIATTLTANGDAVRLDGRKYRVAAGRQVDDLLVLASRTDTGEVALVGLPTDRPELEWTPAETAADIPHWTVTFHGVSLAPDAVLGTVAEPALESYHDESAVLAAARLLGGGRAVLERTIAHVKTREQFDRPIGTFQAVQHQLADVATELDATGLAVAQAGWAVEVSGTPMHRARLAATALLAARLVARRATLVAHQLHGGMGFVLDSPLHLWSARAIADPTVPMDHRRLLDRLAQALGVTADGVVVPPDHRVAAGA
jgi:alkylation response protein AidB-like acyl-CoA dehydrogenase